MFGGLRVGRAQFLYHPKFIHGEIISTCDYIQKHMFSGTWKIDEILHGMNRVDFFPSIIDIQLNHLDAQNLLTKSRKPTKPIKGMTNFTLGMNFNYVHQL